KCVAMKYVAATNAVPKLQTNVTSRQVRALISLWRSSHVANDAKRVSTRVSRSRVSRSIPKHLADVFLHEPDQMIARVRQKSE
ncbi:hypothetical protein, partial [Trinickia sp.]|uniref:hypothetical protein n=1 Tax=Trinickia sp. TaxID=2571163 RepID=UPI003F7EFF8F